MNAEKFVKKHGLNEKFLIYAYSLGLRAVNDEDEEEIKAEMMERFSLRDDEQIENLISELDEMSWAKPQETTTELSDTNGRIFSLGVSVLFKGEEFAVGFNEFILEPVIKGVLGEYPLHYVYHECEVI